MFSILLDSIFSHHVEGVSRIGYVLGAMRFLVMLLNHGPSDNNDITGLLSSLRGVMTMIAALNHFPDDVDAQSEALELLNQVGQLHWSHYEYYASLVEAGVIHTLFSSLCCHASDARVVCKACRLVLRDTICFSIHPFQEGLLEFHSEWHGVIEAVHDLHPDNPQVLFWLP